MDLTDDHNVDKDEQANALLIEMRSFSTEEKCLMAQPRIEQSVETVQTNPSIEEEVVKEPDQAIINQEEEVLESPVLEAEASPEKDAEVSQPDEARSEGEPSKDKKSEKSSSSEGEQAKNDGSSKLLPFLGITATNIHDNILNPYHDSVNFFDIVHKVCEEVLEEEKEKSESELEKDGPEQSMQVHTHISPILTALVDSQEISSNEGLSADGTKLMKSMTELMATLQKNMAVMESNMMKIMKTQTSSKNEIVYLLKTHNEMEQTLKKNTYEFHIVNKSYSKFEKNFFKRKSELFDCERENNIEMHNEADSFARKILEEEDAKTVAEKEKNLITQGEDNRGRRGGDVSTGTRFKRKTSDDNIDRPIKRGGGRSGDRGGRSTGGDRGGRSTGGDRGGQSGGSGRGGHSLPLFHNLLTGEKMSGERFNYPIDPLIKREEQ
ncbi:keratin, type I cytoskeletal 9-like [Impatiens glandulifera]|uniref:keratin, type I cytoskeletal 9-like n=1 Tax=Impatiens glandulifera TaxID=253017 RepID=UPI001FB18319|nr:keratin, type I cytoskeletal 9-like [Impatiens glandulifera]